MASKSPGKGGNPTGEYAKHLRPSGKKVHNAKVRQAAKREIRKTRDTREEDEERSFISDKKDYLNFVNSIVNENYAEANKYLETIIMRKIKNRVKDQINKPLF